MELARMRGEEGALQALSLDAMEVGRTPGRAAQPAHPRHHPCRLPTPPTLRAHYVHTACTLHAHYGHRSSSGKCCRAWRACSPPRLRRWSGGGRSLRCARPAWRPPHPQLPPTLHCKRGPCHPQLSPPIHAGAAARGRRAAPTHARVCRVHGGEYPGGLRALRPHRLLRRLCRAGAVVPLVPRRHRAAGANVPRRMRAGVSTVSRREDPRQMRSQKLGTEEESLCAMQLYLPRPWQMAG